MHDRERKNGKAGWKHHGNSRKRKAGYYHEEHSMFLDIVLRSVRSPGARLGAAILLVMIAVCVLSPLIAPYGYNDMDLTAMFSAPSAKHLMGTDSLGRDILSRLLYGGRYSLAIGFVTAFFAAFISIVFGCIAGYCGGKVESVIMRIMDVWSALPSMLLCILISTALGAGFFNTILALTIGQIPQGVRLMRGQILSERTKEYLEAASSINCSKIEIMFKHLLPNVISPMIVQLTMGIGNNITLAAGLSYIGLGVQPPTPEWGAMLADGRAHILNYPHLVIFPGLFIAFTVLAANLLGDGVRDALDPKLRQ